MVPTASGLMTMLPVTLVHWAKAPASPALVTVAVAWAQTVGWESVKQLESVRFHLFCVYRSSRQGGPLRRGASEEVRASRLTSSDGAGEGQDGEDGLGEHGEGGN
jgi:hypothetical protein